MKTKHLTKTSFLQRIIAIALFLPIGNLPAQTPVNPGKTIYIYCCSPGNCGNGGGANSGNQAVPDATIEAGTTGPESLGGVTFGFRAALPSPTAFSPQSLNMVTDGNVPGNVTFGPPQTGGGLPDTVNSCEICRPVGVPIVTGDGSQVEIRKVSCEGTSAEWGNVAIADATTGNSSGGGGISGVAPMSSPMGSGVSTTTVPTVNIIKADGSIGRYAQAAGSAGGRTWQEGELLQYTSPTGRTIDITTADLEVIRPDGVVRQVKTPSGLTDIQYLPNDNQGFVVNYYPASQVGAKDADGFYTFTGTPLRGLKIENLRWQQRQYNELRITKTEGTRSISSSYHYNEGNREWTRTLADGSRVVQRDTWPIEGTPPVQAAGLPAPANASLNYLIRTKERYDANNTKIATTLSIIWITDADEERLLQEIKDFGGANYAKTITYYNNTEDEATYGKIKSVVESNGSWEYYSYDAMGRVHKNYRPWLDSAFPSSIPTNENGVRVIEYGYSAVTAGDIAPAREERAHTIVERINGIETSRRYNAYFLNTTTGERSMADERAAAQGAAFGAIGNLRRTTTFYSDTADVAIAGKTKTIQNPDNTLRTYTYSLNPATPNAYLTTTQTQGSTSSPSGVAFKSTQTVTTENNLGWIVSEETKVYTGGTTYSTLNILENFYNINGQVTQRKKDDRILYDAEYTNGLLTREVDESGMDAVYTYDDMGELASTLSRGITTTYNRTLGGIDCGCDGSMETTVSAGGLSLTSRVIKDKLGRVIETADHAGLVTTYAYTYGGRVTTILKPNTATEIRENYIDGQSKSLTGTGVIAQYYTYGFNSDGIQWSKTNQLSSAGPRWNKRTRDFLRRPFLNETPGYGAGTVIVSTNVYNTLGQLASKTTSTTLGSAGILPAAGSQTTIYTYNSLNNLVSSTTTHAGQTTPPVANLSERTYFQENGTWFSVSLTQMRYVEGGQQQTITTALSKQKLNGFTGDAVAYDEFFSPPFNVGTAFTLSTPGINKTITSATLNRSTKTAISTATLPTSTQPSIQTITNGLLLSSVSPSHGGTTLYQYDALGRQIGQKQPRHSNYSNITYNAYGQVASSADANGGTTTYAYYANGTAGAGQLFSETNALEHNTYHAYNLRGQEIQTWGSATYPVVQDYDSYGQRNLLKTYRDTSADFNGSSFPDSAVADTTTWIYDGATGIVLQKLYADNKGPSYEYYADGFLKKRIWVRKDASNNPLTTNYGYNAQGLLTNIVYSDTTPTVTYTYNTLGQQTAIADGSGTRTFSYDFATQALAQENFSGIVNGILNRAYDAYGRPTGYVLRDSTIPTNALTAAIYAYDTTGNFSQVHGDTVSSSLATGISTTALVPSTFTYARVPNSDLISTVTSPTHIVTNTYESNRDILTTKQNKITAGTAANTIVSQYDYAVDAIGQRITRAHSGTVFTTNSTDSFTYNPRGEVTSSTNDQLSNNDRRYSYDSIGNRMVTREGASTTPVSFKTYASNALNQYAQISATVPTPPTVVTPSYDDDGNMLTDGTGKVYSWDCENRLIQVLLSNGAAVKYYYDSQGRRVKREHITQSTATATTYLYYGWNVIKESKQSSLSTTLDSKFYVWGMDMSNSLQGSGGVSGLLFTIDRSGDSLKCYFHTYDANGNTSELMDGAGVVGAHYEYDAFGKITTENGNYAQINTYQFSTKPTDAHSHLLYFGTRYYQSETGRWLNRDKIGERGGCNLYRFVRNSPVLYFDVLGYFTGNDHRKITEDAYDRTFGEGGDCAKKFIIDANLKQDDHPGIVDAEGLEMHYNRPVWGTTARIREGNTVDSSVSEWNTRYTNYLDSEGRKFNDLISASPSTISDCIDALKALGRLSHAWQDYYAHARWFSRDSFFNFGFYWDEETDIWSNDDRMADAGDPEHPGKNIYPSSWSGVLVWGSHGLTNDLFDTKELKKRDAAATAFTTKKFGELLPKWKEKCPCVCAGPTTSPKNKNK